MITAIVIVGIFAVVGWLGVIGLHFRLAGVNTRLNNVHSWHNGRGDRVRDRVASLETELGEARRMLNDADGRAKRALEAADANRRVWLNMTASNKGPRVESVDVPGLYEAMGFKVDPKTGAIIGRYGRNPNKLLLVLEAVPVGLELSSMDEAAVEFHLTGPEDSVTIPISEVKLYKED